MKRTKKSGFPHFLRLYNRSKSSVIITDAGHDQISYELALQFFDFETIFEWLCSYDYEDDDQCFILSELEPELPYRYQSKSQEEILKIIEKLLMTYDWLPQEVAVLTAKAIYQEQRWLMLIDLDYQLTYCQGEQCFDGYEEKAIQLGNHLKEELGDDSLIVVNDNQSAVKTMNGFSFDVWLLDKEWAKELAKKTYSVLWAERNFVRQADRLKVQEANRIFSPDALWENELKTQ